jgi:DNA-directed RNA polymerase subunit K/omega
MDNKVKLSRGTSINFDTCVKNMNGNKFNLVLAAAARAREISKRNKANGKIEHECTPVSALLDVQVKLVGPEYLRKVR